MQEKSELQYTTPRLARPKTNAQSRVGRKKSHGMFHAPTLEIQTEDFDYVKPKDALLRAQNQQLYAIRTQINKTVQKPTIARPVTACQHPSTSPISLLTKRRVETLRPVDYTVNKAQKRELEGEKLSLEFAEDPVAYFSKRKDGRGHRFIYLNFADDRSDVAFSPYNLVKVPFAEINEEYFTMSAGGVSHIYPSGVTENFSLDQWMKESSDFVALRKLKMFKFFYYWKPLRIWRRFLMKQRYMQIREEVLQQSMYSSQSFMRVIMDLLESSCTDMVKKNLLCFIPQSRFNMKTFREAQEKNHEVLHEAFSAYLDNVVGYVLELDADIRDPQRLVVKNVDLKESKKFGPKLGDVIALEAKKEAERQRRKQLVRYEMSNFAGFVRMIDYGILETLVQACLDCWRSADKAVSGVMASIFEISVAFSDDGEIVFDPSFEELIKNVLKAFHRAKRTLATLPRLLMSSSIRPHMREVIPNLNEVFEDGPNFEAFYKTNVEFSRLRRHVVDILTANFKEAEAQSQQYKQYFHIYQIGRFWTPESYLKERGGAHFVYDLTTTFSGKTIGDQPIVYNPCKEVIVDFDVIREDVAKFKEDQIAMTRFRACTISGALYMDSKNLRATLTPIPSRTLTRMQEMLKGLARQKMNFLCDIFKIAHARIRTEPKSLETYVDFCYFLKRTEEASPFLTAEMEFVERLLRVIDEVGFPVDDVKQAFGQIHETHEHFQKGLKIAEATKDNVSDTYAAKLEEILKGVERKLKKYQTKLQTFPTTLVDIDIDYLLTVSQQSKAKIEAMAPRIQELILCQEILGKTINRFSSFSTVTQDAQYQQRFYEAVNKWLRIDHQVETVPLVNIEMPVFKEEVLALEEEVNGMQTSAANPLLDEIREKIAALVPYLEPLTQLSSATMKLHHWNQLFEDCGHRNAYYSQIRIRELISMGILNETEKISLVTSTSQGESQLKTEFRDITKHWKEMELPVVAKSDENILIGDIQPILADIVDSQMTVSRMLNVPYVHGIREQVLELSKTLETYAAILEVWTVFQKNWVIVSPIYALEEIKKVIPTPANRFGIVKRKWATMVKHALVNFSLEHICSFPGLLEMLKENNNTVEQLLVALDKLLEMKRNAIPRLYFVSDAELVEMISTRDFNVLNKHVSKLFMSVTGLDSKAYDLQEEASINLPQNFERVKISGLLGSGGDSLTFAKPIQCSGGLEVWLKQVLEGMTVAMKDAVEAALASSKKLKIWEWLESVTINVAILCLYINFCSEIQECFNNLENDIRSFAVYEEKIKSKIDELSTQATLSLTPAQLAKLSSGVVLLNYQMHLTRKLGERTYDYSQAYGWKHAWKVGYDQNGVIQVQMGDISLEHGYEYFGKVKPFIATGDSHRTLKSVAYSLIQTQYMMMVGGEGIGQSHMIEYLAVLFGRPVFSASAYPCYTRADMEKLIMAAIRCDSWLVLRNISNYSHEILCYLYDIFQKMENLLKQDIHTMKLGDVSVSLQKWSRFILMSTPAFLESNEMPPQLKTFLKPVGYSAPDLVGIAGINLMIHGFSTWKVLGRKIVTCLREIQSTFGYLNMKSIFTRIFAVIHDAHVALGGLCHSEEAESKQEPAKCEQFVVCLSIFRMFKPVVRDGHINVLLQLLLANFQLASSCEELQAKILEPCVLPCEKKEEELKTLVRNEIEANYPTLPVDYMVAKVADLWNMLTRRGVALITGGAKSGKTSVVNLLCRVGPKIGMTPLKVLDLYHESDNPENVFGSSNVETKYAQIHAFCAELTAREGTTGVLRFNGPITPRFVKWMKEILRKDSFMLNTRDSYEIGGKLRVIIETSDISHLTPEMLSYFPILPMKNTVISHESSTEPRQCTIRDPEFLFGRLNRRLFLMFPATSVEIIKRHFIEVIPKMVSYIHELKNEVFCEHSNHNMEGGEVILVDHLTTQALLFAALYMKECECDFTNEILVRNVLLFGMFTVFTSILDHSSSAMLDSWIRSNYDIDVPKDWAEFNVPEHFWDLFPRPCLQAMHYVNGILIPLDLESLRQEPIVRKSDQVMTPNSVSVYTAPCLQLMFEAKILVKYNENILLYGPRGCGKTSFLSFLFHKDPRIIPIHIPVSPLSTAQTLFQFIRKHSNVTKKDYILSSNPKIYALIFDNVDPSFTEAVEFIRMLTNTSSVPSFSTSDSKLFELVQLRNYFVVVTATTINTFPARFVSQFVPLRMNAPTSSTSKFVFTSISQVFEMNSDFSQQAFSLFEALKPQFNVMRLLDALCCLEYRRCQTEKETEMMMKALVTEMNMYLLHNQNDPDLRSQFVRKFKIVFPGDLADAVMSDFETQRAFYVPDITYNVGKRVISGKIASQQKNLLKEELNYNYTAFNRRLGEKALLRFTEPVMATYVLLERAITYPGASVILKGPTGVGKRSLSMFIASMKEFEFMDISNHESKSANDARKFIASILEKASVSSKPIVVFTRPTARNAETTRLILSLINDFDFSPYFSDTETDHLYAKMAKTVPSVEAGGIMCRFRETLSGLRMILRFVVSVDDGFESHDYPNAYVINFFEGNHHWERIAEEVLESARIDNSMLVSNLKKIHTGIVSRYCKTCTNDFFDFVSTFVVHMEQNDSDIVTMNKHAKSAASVITKIATVEEELKEKVAKITPKVEEIEKNVSELATAYHNKSDAILARSFKLERDRQHYEEEIEAIKRRMKELQELYGDDLLKLSQSRSVVEGMTSGDLRPLRIQAENMPKQMKKVVVVFCLFLGLKPSYKQVGEELFTRENFLKVILGIDYQNVTPVTVEKVRRVFAGFEFNEEELQSISPFAEKLYRYASSVFNYCRRADDLNKERIKLERKQNEYNKYTRETEQETKAMEQVQATLKDEKLEIDVLEGTRDEMRAKKEALVSRLEKTQEILKGMDEFKQTLEHSIRAFDEQKQMSMGNTILFAVYITYCGRMRKEHVIECLNTVKSELQASGFALTKEDPIVYVSYKVSIVDQSEKSLKLDKFLSQDTETEVKRLKCSLRPPLILDYDGYVTAHLKDSIKKKVIECSLLDDKFESIINDAMSGGKTVIVYDVDYLSKTLEEILPLELMPDDPAIHSTVSVANLSVIRNPKFKLFLVSSLRDPNKIPEDLRVRTSVFVCCENPTLTYKLLTMFRNKFTPDVSYEISGTHDTETLIERVRMERDITELLSEIHNEWEDDETYDLLEDDELVPDFLRVKEKYLENIHVESDRSTTMPDEFSSFLPTVNLLTTFWTALTRYLPRSETCVHFDVNDYLNVLQEAIEKLGEELEDKDIQNALSQAVLRHILPSLTYKQSMFVLFITAFLLNCQEKKCSVDTLDSIVEHCYSELTNVCDFDLGDLLTGDPVNQMKFANISNLFFFMYRSISEVFGDLFEKYFPSFHVENLIPEHEGKPILIRVSRTVYPMQMILNNIAHHSAYDQFVCLSLTDDEEHLKGVSESTKSLAHKLVYVHYTTPSRNSAKAVGNLLKWATKPGMGFKLVILAETLDMLPRAALSCPCYNVDDFPSLRAQMEQIANQYQSLMRSSVNAPAIRKLSFGASLLVSTLNYRSMINPIGYCEPCRFPDSVTKDLVGHIKSLIELRLREIPVKNFSEVIDQLCITPLVSDTFDCERVRCQIANMIRPDITKKEYAFTKTDSIWTMPVDVFKFDYLPTFAFCDILFMDDTISVMLRKWNLSRYFVEPLARLHAKVDPWDIDEAKKMAGNALVTMPPEIFAPDQSKFNSPTNIYLLSEIESFNRSIEEAKLSIFKQDRDVLHSICADKAPKKWLDIFSFAESSSFTRLLSHINDRAFLLKVWLKGHVIPSPTDVRMLSDIRGLFNSYIAEEALKRGCPASDLDFRFIISNDKNPYRTNGFILSNCWLVGVSHANQKLTTATAPFTRIPQLVCEVVPRDDNADLVRCPIFKRLPSTSISGPFDRIDGEVENFIRYAHLPSDLTASECTSNGACIVCQLAEFFA